MNRGRYGRDLFSNKAWVKNRGINTSALITVRCCMMEKRVSVLVTTCLPWPIRSLWERQRPIWEFTRNDKFARKQNIYGQHMCNRFLYREARFENCIASHFFKTGSFSGKPGRVQGRSLLFAMPSNVAVIITVDYHGIGIIEQSAPAENGQIHSPLNRPGKWLHPSTFQHNSTDGWVLLNHLFAYAN